MKDQNQHTKIEKLLLEAARMFNSTLEYEELMGMILQLVPTAVNAEAALVFRVDHHRSDMKVRFMNCLADCDMRIFHWELGQGVVGWVTQYQEPVIINDADNDARVDDAFWTNVGFKPRSIMSVPEREKWTAWLPPGGSLIRTARSTTPAGASSEARIFT